MNKNISIIILIFVSLVINGCHSFNCNFVNEESDENYQGADSHTNQVPVETDENLQIFTMPQGKIVFQTRDGIIWLIELPSLERKMIYEYKDGLLTVVKIFEDGEHISFLSSLENKSNFNTDIILGDIDGSEPRNLTKNGLPNLSPSISPNNKEIVYTSERNVNQEIMHDIYKVNLEGEITQLTNDGLAKYQPTWSPDGLWIAYVFYDEGEQGLAIVDTDGMNNMVFKNDNILPWSGMSWSPNNDMIAIPVNNEGERSILAINVDTFETQYISSEGRCVYPDFFSGQEQLIFTCLDENETVINRYNFNTQEMTEIISFETGTDSMEVSTAIIPETDYFAAAVCEEKCNLFVISSYGQSRQIVFEEKLDWFGNGSVGK